MAKENIPPIVELGTTGLRTFGGYIYEEYDPNLSGKKAITKYQEMLNDAIIAALWFTIQQLARNVDWYVLPATKDQQQDLDNATWLDEQNMRGMEEMPWNEFITEALSMCPFGHSLHEIVYKQEANGDLTWRKLPIRAQSGLLRWDWDNETSEIRGVWQLAPPLYRLTYIPKDKFLLFRTKSSKNNPEGWSILRPAYKAYYYKTRLGEIEAIGAERGVEGIHICWVPSNVDSPSADDAAAIAAKQAFIDLATNIRRDSQEGIVFPLVYEKGTGNKSYDLTLLTTQSTETAQIGTMITRYSNEMLQSVLAEFIMLGTKSVGSYALSSNKTEIFMKALNAFLDAIEEVFNTYAVPRLFALNPQKDVSNGLPEIKHKPAGDPDPKLMAAVLALFPALGWDVSTDIQLENFTREAIGLPPKPEEESDNPIAKNIHVQDHKELVDSLAQGAIGKNEYRKRHGLKELSPKELAELEAETSRSMGL